MKEIKVITGKGIPLIGHDIDTDRIIPSRFMCCVTFDGLGKQVFADDRIQAKGQHSFDQIKYQGAEVLVVNQNFGCGSSREHAPQALARWGIKAIIGESFAEIFFGNCLAMGIPCVTAIPKEVQHLQEIILFNLNIPIQIDLENMTVQQGNFSTKIQMTESSRQTLIMGTWNACEQLVSQKSQIIETEAKLPYGVIK